MGQDVILENLHDSEEKDLINLLKERVDLHLLFLSGDTPDQQVYTILLTKHFKSLPEAVLTEVERIFLSFKKRRFRIYSLYYAESELRNGNLYFIRNCLFGEVLFRQPQKSMLLDRSRSDEHLQKALEWLAREKRKISGFKSGVAYYRQIKNWEQTAFMLHQMIELQFRCLEYFVMGKNYICHRIANHIKYVTPFFAEVAQWFPENDGKQQELLKVLDKAYVEVRYSNKYSIQEQQVHELWEKARLMEKDIQEIFDECLKECYRERKQLERNPVPQADQIGEGFLPNTSLESKNAIEIISEELEVLQVVCLGRRTRIRSSTSIAIENPEHQELLHFDLLVISEGQVFVHPNKVSQKVWECSERKVSCTLIFSSSKEVHQGIRKADIFFNMIFEKGQVLYTKPGFNNGFRPGSIDLEQFTAKAEKDFSIRQQRANYFLQAWAGVSGKDDVTEIYLIHLALQQICLGAIFVTFGYRPPHHNLGYLMDLCSNFSTAPQEFFGHKSMKENEVSQQLIQSDRELRFKTSDKRSIVDVKCLHRKAEAFIKGMTAIAQEKQNKRKAVITKETAIRGGVNLLQEKGHLYTVKTREKLAVVAEYA